MISSTVPPTSVKSPFAPYAHYGFEVVELPLPRRRPVAAWLATSIMAALLLVTLVAHPASPVAHSTLSHHAAATSKHIMLLHQTVQQRLVMAVMPPKQQQQQVRKVGGCGGWGSRHAFAAPGHSACHHANCMHRMQPMHTNPRTRA